MAKNVLLLMTTENMRKPKQGVGNLQGLFGTTESNRPEQTSKGPKSWARTCRHSTSNVQIFNSWWYTKRTDTGHGKWCRVLEVLVVPDIDLLVAWARSRNTKAEAKGLASRGTPELWEEAVYPCLEWTEEAIEWTSVSGSGQVQWEWSELRDS